MVRVRIRARDIMLALDEPPNGSSANNVVPATIAGISTWEDRGRDPVDLALLRLSGAVR